MLTKFKELINAKITSTEDHPYKTIIMAALILGIAALLIQISPEKSSEKKTKENFSTADTYIPKGHTLVPIEVANYESLDSIIGQFGVVDLFTTPLNPSERAQRIAYSVKIIRAPRNPNYFAVLMPEEKAGKIAGFHGPITVAVRNPTETGTHFVKAQRRKKKRKIYFDLE